MTIPAASPRRLAPVRVVLPLAVLAGCAPPAPEREPPPRRPVGIETVRAGSHRPTILLLGRLEPAERVPIAVRAAGVLRHAPRFRPSLAAGTQVAEGEVLGVIENAVLPSALAEAEIEEQRRASRFEALARSHGQGLVSDLERQEAELDLRLARQRLESARHQAAGLTVRAPRSGRLLVDRPVPDGIDVAVATVLAEVAAEGPARIEARAAAGDRRWLEPGLEARVQRAGGTALGRAELRTVAPVVDGGGTVRVVLEATALDPDVTPGEGVEVVVELAERPAALTVAEESLVAGDEGSCVYVLDGSQWSPSVRRVPVETGLRGGGRVEIVRGLRDGDRVVVAGAAFVRDGDGVAPVEDERGVEAR